MLYFDGKHKTRVLGIRKVLKENYNPMVWNLIEEGRRLEDCVQILISFLNQGNVWINVYKKDLCPSLDTIDF